MSEHSNLEYLGKPSRYSHLVVSRGAGPLKGEVFSTYRDEETGLHYTRQSLDHDLRMLWKGHEPDGVYREGTILSIGYIGGSVKLFLKRDLPVRVFEEVKRGCVVNLFVFQNYEVAEDIAKVLVGRNYALPAQENLVQI